MKSSTSTHVLAKDCTPAYLAHLLDAIGPEDSIELLKRDGKIKIALKIRSGKKTESTTLRNFLFLKPRTEPIHNSWMPGFLGEPTEGDYVRRHAHRKIVNKEVSRATKARSMLYAALCMEMDSKSIGDGTMCTFPTGVYWRFEVGDFWVFTKADLKPVYAKEGERGENIYFEAPKEELGTYKMSASKEVVKV